MAFNVVEEEGPQILPLLYKVMDKCTNRIEAQEEINEQLFQMIMTLTKACNRHVVASHLYPHTGESSVAHQSPRPSLLGNMNNDVEALVTKKDLVEMSQNH